MPTPETDHDMLIRLQAEVRSLSRQVEAGDRKINELLSDRKSFLMHGVIALGAVVATLVGYIWVSMK